MRALRNHRQLSELQCHHSNFTHRSSKGKPGASLRGASSKDQPGVSSRKITGSAQRRPPGSVFFNLKGDTRRLTLQKVICGGRGDTCIHGFPAFTQDYQKERSVGQHVSRDYANIMTGRTLLLYHNIVYISRYIVYRDYRGNTNIQYVGE